MSNFTWRIGGKAGEGILNMGNELFARTCMRMGFNVFSEMEYPSLIRGGYNTLDVHISDEEVYSHGKFIDLLVAMNEETIEKSKDVVRGGIIFDKEIKPNVRGIKLFPIPMREIAEKSGSMLYSNAVAIGASFALMGLDLIELNKIFEETFARKGEKVVEQNKNAAKDGYDYAKRNFQPLVKLEKRKREDNILIDGNSATVLGAIKAGCKFLSAYPMTPATSILTGMASYSRDYNIIVKHTEDEITSINMAIGAGYAGVRAMTCTSGGGFCLMTEGFGLALQAEVPLVVVNSQRPGPATGMATRTGQGDLRFVLHASTDDTPRVVIAPGDINECFYYTQIAFNLAEKYQMPIIILLDKFISTCLSSVKSFDKEIKIERGKISKTIPADFLRYKFEKDGVSLRSVPGQENGEHVASSYEHDEHGEENEDIENKNRMTAKRMLKFETLKKDIPEPFFEGKSDIVLVGWGSTKGIIRETRKILKGKGVDASQLHLAFVSPFPIKYFEKLKGKKIFCIENNEASQLAGIIREQTGIDTNKITRYDGRQFNPDDLAEEIMKMIK